MIVARYGTARSFGGVYAEVGYGEGDDDPVCISVSWLNVGGPTERTGGPIAAHADYHWTPVGPAAPIRFLKRQVNALPERAPDTL